MSGTCSFLAVRQVSPSSLKPKPSFSCVAGLVCPVLADCLRHLGRGRSLVGAGTAENGAVCSSIGVIQPTPRDPLRRRDYHRQDRRWELEGIAAPNCCACRSIRAAES